MENISAKYITRDDELRFLQTKVLENPIFDKPLKFDDIISNILSGEIPLEITNQEGTIIMDDDAIDEIEDAMGDLFDVVKNPRTFIKTSEEKVPVERAKSINFKAISKLSRDCNDWYARTLTGVKAKNIVADVKDETINIYENRVVAALIKLIYLRLNQAKAYYDNELKNINDSNDLTHLKEDFECLNNSFSIFNKITKIDQYFGDDDYEQKIIEKIKKLESLISSINKLKISDFCRYLNKKRKVKNPIQKTNIFVFEKRYRKLYKLYNTLLFSKVENEKLVRDDIEKESIDFAYRRYSLILLLASLKDLEFKEKTNSYVEFLHGGIHFEKPRIFTKGNTNIKLSIIKDNVSLFFTYDDNTRINEEVILKISSEDFETLNRIEIGDKTEEILNLNSTLMYDKRGHQIYSSCYEIVLMNLHRSCNDNIYSDKVCKRFNHIGNFFDSHETKENMKKRSNYKCGIFSICPSELRYNFLRLEKIINFYSIKHTKFNGELDRCPLCGGKHIRKRGVNDYECRDCMHSISITYCKHCDPQKKNPIIWVKYQNDGFMKKTEITSKFESLDNFKYYSKLENLMGERTTTGFEVEKETNGRKLKTICPVCGVKLGED